MRKAPLCATKAGKCASAIYFSVWSCHRHDSLLFPELPWQRLPVQDFITHCWREPFHEFMDSLRHAYDVAVVKPHLFICAFSLFQGHKGFAFVLPCALPCGPLPCLPCSAGAAEDIQEALGQSIAQAPFAPWWQDLSASKK